MNTAAAGPPSGALQVREKNKVARGRVSPEQRRRVLLQGSRRASRSRRRPTKLTTPPPPEGFGTSRNPPCCEDSSSRGQVWRPNLLLKAPTAAGGAFLLRMQRTPLRGCMYTPCPNPPPAPRPAPQRIPLKEIESASAASLKTGRACRATQTTLTPDRRRSLPSAATTLRSLSRAVTTHAKNSPQVKEANLTRTRKSGARRRRHTL